MYGEPNATVDELLFMTAADGAYQRKLVSLAYLAPDIQERSCRVASLSISAWSG